MTKSQTVLLLTLALSILLLCEETFADEVAKFTKKEEYCLAQNIYFESRGEETEGQIAVAHVTMNRVVHKKFPNTICKVVWQNKQFSWTHDGKSDKPRHKVAWAKAQQIARDVLNGELKDNTNGSLFFHTAGVSPYWKKKVTFEKRIGYHLFYSWDGKW